MKKLLVMIVAALALVACGGSTGAEDTWPGDSGDGYSSRNQTETEERIVPLSDGRRITCIISNGYKSGGISCDWNPKEGT